MTNHTTYVPQLTFLRFMAAVWVVVFHYGQLSSLFQVPVISKLASEGSVAVSFFFFLSGLVLMLSYGQQKISINKFLIKRWARIYPIYLLAFVSTLIIAMLLLSSFPRGLSIILQGLALHAWIPGICLEINFPAWSISVEVFFYLLFPLILWLLNKAKFIYSALFIVLFWAFFAWLHYYLKLYPWENPNDKTGQFILYFPLWHLNTFLMGTLGGRSILSLRNKSTSFLWIWRTCYSIGFSLFIFTFVIDNPFRPFVHNGLLSPLFFFITVGLSLDRSWLTHILSHKTLVWLGDVSYSVYIIQFPVYIIYTQLWGLENVNGNHFYAYLILLICLSGLLYTFFEKPVQKLIVRKWVNSANTPFVQ